MKAHVQCWDGGANESRGGSVGVGGTTGAGGVVLSDDLVDGGRQVNKKIVFKVSGGACEVGMVGLRKLGDSVNGR